MDYTQMDAERKRELLTNSNALITACNLLSSYTGIPCATLIGQLHAASHKVVHAMSEKEVRDVIIEMEQRRSQGIPIVIAKEKR